MKKIIFLLFLLTSFSALSGDTNFISTRTSSAINSKEITATTSLILQDPGSGTNTITLQSPTLSSNYTLTLPTDYGTANQTLITDGSGGLSWSTTLSSTDIDTSAELAAVLTDETGSGLLVFGTSPTITAPSVSGIQEFTSGDIFTTTKWQIGRDTDTTNNFVHNAPTNSSHVFSINGTNICQIDADQLKIAGSTTFVSDYNVNGTTGFNPGFILSKNDATRTSQYVVSDTATTSANFHTLHAGGTIGSETAAPTDARLGGIFGYAHDGTNFNISTAMIWDVDGTVGNDDTPGKFTFSTATASATGVTEALRINKLQNLILGKGEGGTTAATGNTFRAHSIVAGGAGNVAGADLNIAAGLGTGTGDVGTISFLLPTVAAAGDNLQSYVTPCILDMVSSTTVATLTLNANTIISGTWDDLGIVTTVDVNGGTIDGATIGGASAAAGTFTTLTATGDVRLSSKTTGITAGSTQTQVGATALTSFFNQVSTVGTQYDGVKLPTAVAGLMVGIQNIAGTNLKIWPASGDDLGEGVDTGKTWNSNGANSKIAWFLALDETTWVRWQGESLS